MNGIIRPPRAADTAALTTNARSFRASLSRLDHQLDAAGDDFRRALHGYGEILLGHDTGALEGPAHDRLRRAAETLAALERERRRVWDQLDDLLVAAVARHNPTAVIVQLNNGTFGGDPEIFARPVKTTAEAIRAVQVWLSVPARVEKLTVFRQQGAPAMPEAE